MLPYNIQQNAATNREKIKNGNTQNKSLADDLALINTDSNANIKNLLHRCITALVITKLGLSTQCGINKPRN